MSQFWQKQQIATITAGSTGNQALHACGCVGPQRGEPYCPCRMRGVIERDGRWIEQERDLGPVRRYDPLSGSGGQLADATHKNSPHTEESKG